MLACPGDAGGPNPRGLCIPGLRGEVAPITAAAMGATLPLA